MLYRQRIGEESNVRRSGRVSWRSGQGGYLLATIATGAITARYGPRAPVIASCLLFAVGAGGVALASGPVLLAIGVTVAGASAGGTWAPFSDAVPEQVPRPGHERALALVNAGAPMGLVVASALALATGDHWRVAWGIFAALGLIAAAVNARALSSAVHGPGGDQGRIRVGWLVNRESAGLLVAAAAMSLTSGAYPNCSISKYHDGLVQHLEPTTSGT